MKALSDLVALGEGSTLEFKRSLRSDLGREICAFANAAGGVILLGVDDNREGPTAPSSGTRFSGPCWTPDGSR
ncbi:MAG: ATP-binding protein [Gemmatimonadota bacterium]|nr:ATP-binding protein [Gemmatimonadota bacterium]